MSALDSIFEINYEYNEFGLFPVKMIDDVPHVIVGWSSIADIFTALDDNDNLLNIQGIGPDGFDFDFSPA